MCVHVHVRVRILRELHPLIFEVSDALAKGVPSMVIGETALEKGWNRAVSSV